MEKSIKLHSPLWSGFACQEHSVSAEAEGGLLSCKNSDNQRYFPLRDPENPCKVTLTPITDKQYHSLPGYLSNA